VQGLAATGVRKCQARNRRWRCRLLWDGLPLDCNRGDVTLSRPAPCWPRGCPCNIFPVYFEVGLVLSLGCLRNEFTRSKVSPCLHLPHTRATPVTPARTPIASSHAHHSYVCDPHVFSSLGRNVTVSRLSTCIAAGIRKSVDIKAVTVIDLLPHILPLFRELLSLSEPYQTSLVHFLRVLQKAVQHKLYGPSFSECTQRFHQISDRPRSRRCRDRSLVI